ncbi:MAG: hypothetical protein JEZ08_13380 [Clostridiales bacterium]|nr:hypothetical protein [Clostridiales bacterium]
MINERLLVEAIYKKFEERDSMLQLKDIRNVYLETVKSTGLIEVWNSYRTKYEYAQGIKHEDVITEILKIVELLNKECQEKI